MLSSIIDYYLNLNSLNFQNCLHYNILLIYLFNYLNIFFGVFMGIITIKISDHVEKLLREAAFKKYGGKRGAISRIIEEALLNWLAREKSSVRIYRVLLNNEIILETSDLDEVVKFLKENNLSPRDVRIIIIPRKEEYKIGPRRTL